MELGCGNSQLCEELYKDGISQITCIDLSAVAVEKMQKRLLANGYNGMRMLNVLSRVAIWISFHLLLINLFNTLDGRVLIMPSPYCDSILMGVAIPW